MDHFLALNKTSLYLEIIKLPCFNQKHFMMVATSLSKQSYAKNDVSEFKSRNNSNAVNNKYEWAVMVM